MASSSVECSGGRDDVRRWFLSLTAAERCYALALDDSDTVALLLALHHQRAVKGDGYFFDLNADTPHTRRASSSTSSHLSTQPADALNALHLITRAKDDTPPSHAHHRRTRHRSNSSSASSSPPHLIPPLPTPPTSPPPPPPSYGFKAAHHLHTMFHSSPSKQAAEAQLEAALRLCDTRTYCDTMMITPTLLDAQGGCTFLSIMDCLSQGKFLSSPPPPLPPSTSSSQQRKGRPALWEGPAWFRSLGFFSFATFVASKLELVMWRRYREGKGGGSSVGDGIGGEGVGGGGGGGGRSVAERRGLVRERLSSKEPLEVFWAGLSRERREKVWGKLMAMVEAVRRRDDTDDSRSATSETSHSTQTETDAVEWAAADEEKQISPSFVVSPLDGRSPSSATHHSHGHPHSDINSAPISTPRSRGRSVSPPPTRTPRRKPSLPIPSTSSAFPFSPLLRQGARQISIPSSTASISSNTSSPALSPSSSCSSVPSRAHTPSPEHQRNRSSSALSASSATSCPPHSAGKRKTTSERRKERKKAEQRERLLSATTPSRMRSQTGSWDGGAFAASLDLWDDASSTQSMDDSIHVQDHHDVQRGVEKLLKLLRALRLESRTTAASCASTTLRERKEPTTPTVTQRAFSGRETEERKEGAEDDGSSERPAVVVDFSASQPLPSSPRSPHTGQLPPLFLASASFSKASPSSASASVSPSVTSTAAVSSPPSLTLTLAELQSSPTASVPLPSPSSLSSSRFIDFLFFSPLNRAHTSLDLIIRRMGIVVQAVYAETMGMDLIMGEEGEEEESHRSLAEQQRKKRAKKKQKQKKRRAKGGGAEELVKGESQKTSPSGTAAEVSEKEKGESPLAAAEKMYGAGTVAGPEQRPTEEAERLVAVKGGEEEELKVTADAESSEQSSSSGDDESQRAEQWTEVVREERRKEEKRRQRKRLQAAARAKDDFFTTASSSSLLSSQSPSLYSRPSATSCALSSSGLPPRSPIRAKDDIFYTDRAPRSSSASSYGLTTLPLSRGVSILPGSPSPASWGKVAYQNSSRSTPQQQPPLSSLPSAVTTATTSASIGSASTNGVWSNHSQQQLTIPPTTSSSGGGAPHIVPSSPPISSMPPASPLSPAAAPKRASSSSAAAIAEAQTAVDASVTLLPPSVAPRRTAASSSPSIQSASIPPQLSPPPVVVVTESYPPPSQLPPASAARPSFSQLSPSVAAFVQAFTSGPPAAAPSPSTLSVEPPLPTSSAAAAGAAERKLSTAELIALHEASVRAAAAAPRDPLVVDASASSAPASYSSSSTSSPRILRATRTVEEEQSVARSRSEASTPPAAVTAPPSSQLTTASSPAPLSSSFRSASSLIPSKEEMRAAIAQAQAQQQQLHQQHGAGGHNRAPGHPLNAWQFWQEQQQRQSQEQQQMALQRQTQPTRQSIQPPQIDVPADYSQPPPPPPQPQLRTYPPIRGPIMSLSSLPPQFRRDSSASSSPFSSTSSGLSSPSLSDSLRTPPRSSVPSTSVAAMIRAYERQRQIESMNIARGWDRQRPHLLVSPFAASHQSTSSSPSSHSPHIDFAQPHSAPLIPHHLAGARFSPLLIDQPLRPTPSMGRSEGLSERRRGSSHAPLVDAEQERQSAMPCPPWLSLQSVGFFALRRPSVSSCSYCDELAEKAKAGAVAPGRARELNRSEQRMEEMTPQQQALLLARTNGVGAIMQAQQTVKPTILPNFIVTPAIYPQGHPLAPLPPSCALQQMEASSTPLSPHHPRPHHPRPHHHHHHHVERGGDGGLLEGLRLHREIEAFTAYVSHLSTVRHPLLLSLMLRVRDCVLSLWPSAAVHSYGSFMTGLGLPSSDLDLVLLHVPVDAKSGLQQLAGVLQVQHAWVVSMNAIDTARVPVIKVVGQVDGRQAVVDITFDQVGDHSSPTSDGCLHPSMHSGLASVDLLCHFVAVFPSLRPLTLVLKQFLYERGLSSTYTGGLNSYCLVLMVVAFLQSRPDAHRHYLRHQRAVHEQIHTQRAHQRAIMEHLSIAVPDLPPIPPLSRPSSSLPTALQPLSPLLPPSSPLAQPIRGLFTLNAQSPAFQPCATLAGPSLSHPTGVGPRSVPSSPLPPSSVPGLPTVEDSPALSSAAGGDDDLGVLLVDLLTFYATEFDWTSMGIAVQPPPTMPHLQAPSLDGVVVVEDSGGCFFHLQVSSATLVLSDPFYPLLVNNIGKAVFGMWRVKGALEDGLKALKGERPASAMTLLNRLIEGPAVGSV